MTDARTSQIGLEVWAAPAPPTALYSTQIGVESWQTYVPAPNSVIQFTQIGAEVWITPGALIPPTTLRSTQIGAEVWYYPAPYQPAQYLLLVPHYLIGPASAPEFVWYPGGTTVTEGQEIPAGWVPTFAVDPLNPVAVRAFWNAGPFLDAEYSRDYYPWIPVKAAVTRWEQILGKPGQYQLTGLGASLGAKAIG